MNQNEKASSSVYNEIFIKKIYEKRGMKIEENENWFDFGANVGLFSAYVLQKGAKIIAAYEPSRECVEQMLGMDSLAGLNIKQEAIWIRREKKTFYVCADGNFQRNTLMNHYKRKEMHTREIICEDISNIVFEGCCVKMDIEGAELAIIDEKPEVFNKVKKMVMEYHTDKDPSLINYYRRIDELKKHFNILKYDNLKQKDGSLKGNLKIFPSGRLIFGWNNL